MDKYACSTALWELLLWLSSPSLKTTTESPTWPESRRSLAFSSASHSTLCPSLGAVGIRSTADNISALLCPNPTVSDASSAKTTANWVFSGNKLTSSPTTTCIAFRFVSPFILPPTIVPPSAEWTIVSPFLQLLFRTMTTRRAPVPLVNERMAPFFPSNFARKSFAPREGTNLPCLSRAFTTVDVAH